MSAPQAPKAPRQGVGSTVNSRPAGKIDTKARGNLQMKNNRK